MSIDERLFSSAPIPSKGWTPTKRAKRGGTPEVKVKREWQVPEAMVGTGADENPLGLAWNTVQGAGNYVGNRIGQAFSDAQAASDMVPDWAPTFKPTVGAASLVSGLAGLAAEPAMNAWHGVQGLSHELGSAVLGQTPDFSDPLRSYEESASPAARASDLIIDPFPVGKAGLVAGMALSPEVLSMIKGAREAGQTKLPKAIEKLIKSDDWNAGQKWGAGYPRTEAPSLAEARAMFEDGTPQNATDAIKEATAKSDTSPLYQMAKMVSELGESAKYSVKDLNARLSKYGFRDFTDPLVAELRGNFGLKYREPSDPNSPIAKTGWTTKGGSEVIGKWGVNRGQKILDKRAIYDALPASVKDYMQKMGMSLDEVAQEVAPAVTPVPVVPKAKGSAPKGDGTPSFPKKYKQGDEAVDDELNWLDEQGHDTDEARMAYEDYISAFEERDQGIADGVSKEDLPSKEELKELWSDFMEALGRTRPKPGRGQDAPSWTPPTVGIGAGEGDFTSWINNEAAALGDAWRRGDRWSAASGAALLPFDALNKGIDYGLGVTMGGIGALAGADNYNNWLGAGPIKKDNIFDWKTAQENTDTLNPVWRMGLETAPQLALSAPIKALEGLTQGMKFATGAEKLGGIGSLARTEARAGVPGAIEKALSVTDNPAVKAGAMIVPAVGAAKEGWEYKSPDGTEPDLGSRLLRTGMSAAGGFGAGAVGMGILGLGRRGVETAIGKRFYQAPDNPNFTAETKDALGKIHQASQMSEGYNVPGISDHGVYPGGEIGMSRDALRSKLSDTGSFFKTWNNYFDKSFSPVYDPVTRERATDFYRAYRLVQGAARKGEQNLRFLKADLSNVSKDELAGPFSDWLNLKSQLERAMRGKLTNEEFKFSRYVETDPLTGAITKDIRPGGSRGVLEYEDFALGGEAASTHGKLWKQRYEDAHKKTREAYIASTVVLRAERVLADYESVALSPDQVTRFNNAAQTLTKHFNALLYRKMKSGLITQEQMNEAINRVGTSTPGFPPIYTFMADQQYMMDTFAGDPTLKWMFGEQGRQGRTYLARERGIDWEHDSKGLSSVTLPQMLEHFLTGDALADKNAVFLKLKTARDAEELQSVAGGASAPTGLAAIMRPVAQDQLDRPVPKGWARISGFYETPAPSSPVHATQIAKQTYEVPQYFADALMGLTTENSDFATRTMSKFNSVFRQAITTMSIPFMMRNIPRDLQTVLMNNGLNSLTFKNYIGSIFDVLTNGRMGQFMEKTGFDPLAFRTNALIDPATVRDALTKPGGGKMTWAEEMMASGGGMGTVSENMRIRGNAAETVDSLMEGNIHWGDVINPFEWMRKAAEISELSTRVGVYRTARLAGKSREASAMLAREASVDFSKSGSVGRIMNHWVPLLNARVQGELRSIQAMQEDPIGYATRELFLTVMPLVATYRHNMETFGDVYPKTPDEITDNNFAITVGKYTTPSGDVRPINMLIPMDNAQKLLSAPILHLLRSVYMTEFDGKPLDPAKRNERSFGRMMLDDLANQFPVNVNTDELFDGYTWPLALVKSAGQAMPWIGGPMQLAFNQDWKTGRAIFNPNMLYAGPDEAAEGASGPTVDLIAKALGVTPFFKPAPTHVGFLVKTLGGGMMQTFLGATDVLVESMHLAPPPPVDWKSLRVPDGMSPEEQERLAAQIDKVDYRPWIVKNLGWWFSGSGGALSQASKIENMNQKDQDAYRQSRAAEEAYQTYLNNTDADGWQGKRRQIEKNLESNQTHAQVANEILNVLYKGRKEVRDSLKTQYPSWITDPKERNAFHAKMPGMPIDAEWNGALLKMGSPSEIARAAEEWKLPPAVAGNPAAAQNPMVLDKARWEYVNTKAREMGIEPNDLMDQIKAYTSGRKLPLITVPASYIEDLANEYKLPEINGKLYDPDKYDKETMDLARARVVEERAREWGIPVQTLWDRLQVRLSYPEEQSPMLNSFEKALALSARSRDGRLYPKYLDAAGNPLGSETDWELNDQTLLKYQGISYDRLPPWIRQLKDAAARGNVARLNFLYNDPDYAEYDRWFGSGRNMSGGVWDRFNAGEVKKYKVGTPTDWAKMDATISLYSAMPQSSPQRRQLAATVKRYKSLMSKEWRYALAQAQGMLDEESGLAAERAALLDEEDDYGY